jgi:hypothetical protein
MISKRFVFPLVYQDISIERKKFTLLLEENFAYLDSVYGYVWVPRGFDFDLMSIPQPLQSFMPKVDVYNAACVIHDWLYSLQPYKRSECDKIFKRALADCGVGVFKRNMIYSFVRVFGFVRWNQVRTEDIYWAKNLLENNKPKY